MKTHFRRFWRAFVAVLLCVSMGWILSPSVQAVPLAAQDSNPIKEFVDQVLGSGTSKQVEGDLDQAYGKAKETTGEVVDDPQMAAEGKAKQMEGQLDQAQGKMARSAEDTAEDIQDQAEDVFDS